MSTLPSAIDVLNELIDKLEAEKNVILTRAVIAEIQLVEREKTILILKVRYRIEELEKRFLKPFMLKWTRYNKWSIILDGNQRNLRSPSELMRFRNIITIAHHEFITTVCNLYGEFSDLAAHNIFYPISYDETSISQMLINFGMIPDHSKINTVVLLLTPIP